MTMKTFVSTTYMPAFAVLSSLNGCNGGSGTPSGAAGATSTGAAGMGSAGTGSAGTGSAGTSAAGTSGNAGTGVDAAAGTTTDGGADALKPIGACTPPAKADQPIVKLTETGCVDPKNPTKLSSVVLPYEVNSPLWSDDTDKFRGMVIPPGKKIHVKDCAATPAECPQGMQDDGKWVMPVGTVMVKSFGFDAKLIETRLFVRADENTWNGYSYQWNEAQTEATVVPADEDPSLNNMRAKVSFNTGKRVVEWIFPYRFDCGGCHTQSAGGTLGPETRQMNRMVGAKNQMDDWKALFDAPPKMLPALVLPYDGQLGKVPAGATIEERARSYLHANCAYCHRPDGVFNSIDFRIGTTLKATGACGVEPMKSTLGVAGALVMKAGKPMESTMWLRMNAPYSGDKIRMPQLATYVVDKLGLALIGDWITSVTACPP
jgi:hypothetical protein